MNKKLLLLCLLAGSKLFALDIASEQKNFILDTAKLIQENDIMRATLASNSAMFKQIGANTYADYLKPAASYTWTNVLVPGVATAGHYAAMPLKYGANVYMDNWMYTIPATLAVASIYAIYKCSDAIWYNLGQWCMRKSGRKQQPGNGTSAIVNGNNNIVRI